MEGLSQPALLLVKQHREEWCPVPVKHSPVSLEHLFSISSLQEILYCLQSPICIDGGFGSPNSKLTLGTQPLQVKFATMKEKHCEGSNLTDLSPAG